MYPMFCLFDLQTNRNSVCGIDGARPAHQGIHRGKGKMHIPDVDTELFFFSRCDVEEISDLQSKGRRVFDLGGLAFLS
jgi:hypothetical protein